MQNKLLNWFYSTWLGNLYVSFVIWLDNQTEKRYLPSTETINIVKENHKITEGVNRIKRKVVSIVKTQTDEEYNKVLSGIGDLTPLANYDKDHPKAMLAEVYRKVYVSESEDKNPLEARAKYINQRLDDLKDYHNQVEKRKLLRELRLAEKSKDLELYNKLKEEYDLKYGRINRR